MEACVKPIVMGEDDKVPATSICPVPADSGTFTVMLASDQDV